MKIAVIFGGISTERNVSLTGGKAVIKALKEKGHDILPIDPAFGADCLISDDELINPSVMPTLEELKKYSPKLLIDCVNSKHFDEVDAAFIVLHGKYGEDGTIQALLELRGIPYTGSNVKASSISIDKISSKMMFIAAGIPTPQFMVVSPKNYHNYEFFEEIRDTLGKDIVIKPNDQGSTIGITILDSGNLDDIHDAIVEASKYSKYVLVEQFIDGREITAGIVGGEALPIIEIVPESGFYDYEHKYSKGKTEYVCPAEISDDITEFTQNVALSVYQAIGCSGFSRVDFRLDEDGQPYCLEINTIPGFTETSLVPKAAAEVGIDFPELCERIIEIALEDFNGKNGLIEN